MNIDYENKTKSLRPNARLLSATMGKVERFRVEEGRKPLGAWKTSREEAWKSAYERVSNDPV